jgi:predicted CXXCH cytochrome family protein
VHPGYDARVRFALVVVAVAACDAASTTPPPAPDPRPPAPTTASNVQRADYVGPDRCGACHPDQHARWAASLHAVMNARADAPGAVIGDFADRALVYAGKTVRFTRDDHGYAMTLDGRAYRVTRTIGRRGLQEYVGVGDNNVEVRLPFGWWPRRGGWYPQPYFDPWLDEASFDAFAAPAEPWAERCPWCHSTYPFAQRIARFDAIGVGHGLERTVAAAFPNGSATLDTAAQVTTGISCESCHLGGRDHAAGGAIRFTPLGATRFADERRDAGVVNAVCAQCHSGPSPRLADGTALRNSSEALDLAASPCTTARCTDCHDPHAGDGDGQIEARAVAACVRCHDRFADPDIARGHAGAHADVPGVSCLDCHMPRVVMGLDHYVRSHRISSPTDPRILGDAGPNACNLCHLDRSIRWTVAALARDHDAAVALPRTAARSYGGDLDVAVGEAWLADARPALRVLAAHAYARRPALGRAALPLIGRGLVDKLAYVRAWTLTAVEDLRGHRGSYDPMQPSAAAAQRLLDDAE